MHLTHAAAAIVLALAPLASAAVPAVSASHAAAPTSTGDFTFTSFTADYYLGRDDGHNATLRTVEKLVANFPSTDQNHGIDRNIPTSYGDVDLNLNVVSVTNADGTPLHYSQKDTDYGYTKLRIGDADRYVHGTQTYVITYKERNVIRSFTDTKADEFYWDVNGTAWNQPFDRVTARVHLQSGLENQLTEKQAC